MTEDWGGRGSYQPEPKEEKGYKLVPSINKERYTELPGLEGPFRTKSGKVLYYDPKEGKYYDRDSDMYLSYKEYEAYNSDRVREANTKTATDMK